MASLSVKNRKLITQVFADDESYERNKVVPGQQDVLSAVNAIDDWVEASRSSFNAAIPEPAKAGLTAKQKLKLFKLIIDKRLEVS